MAFRSHDFLSLSHESSRPFSASLDSVGNSVAATRELETSLYDQAASTVLAQLTDVFEVAVD